MTRRATLALVVLALVAGSAAAQSRWERQVTEQLRVVGQDLAPRGFHTAGEPFVGELGQGKQETFRLALRTNVTYMLVGLCDEDCKGLELRLLDERDKEVTASVQQGDKPALEVTTETPGKFRLVVTMAQCNTGPCAYGVGIFSK